MGVFSRSLGGVLNLEALLLLLFSPLNARITNEINRCGG